MSEFSQPRFAATGLTQHAWPQPTDAAPRDGIGLPLGLVLLFLSALYSQLTMQIPALGAAGGMNLLGGFTIAAVAAHRLLNRAGLHLVWPESYLLLAFVAAAALSCAGALWPRYALDSTVDLLKYVAVYFLIVHTVENRTQFRAILWTLVLGGLFPALGTLHNYATGNLEEGRALWIGIFGNPNEAAYSLIILVPLATYLALKSRGWRAALVWLVLLSYVAAIGVTFSRGGMLGLLVVAVLLAYRWRSAPVMILAVLLVAGGIAFLLYGWTRGEGFTSLDSDLNVQQRLVTFQGGLAMFLEHPLTGVGLGCSLIAWPLYAPPGLYTRSWLVIHNTFVQALSETGLLGFLSFAFLLGAAIYRSRKLSAQPDADLARAGSALEVSLWGMIVCGMSGGYVLTWFPYILFALVTAAGSVFTSLAEGESRAEAA